jgi:hypothetical protein
MVNFRRWDVSNLFIRLFFYSLYFFVVSFRFHERYGMALLPISPSAMFRMQRKEKWYRLLFTPSLNSYLFFFLSLTTFSYTEFTTYENSCSLNTSASDRCI